MSQEIDERRKQKPAKEKLMDYLARRDHSERELRQKLSRRYEPKEVDEAIEWAQKQNWMLPPETLAARVTDQLHRRRKGYRYIQQFLKQKGLPNVNRDMDIEFEKGLELAIGKLEKDPPFDYEDQKRIYRLLANRGFDPETIRKVAKHSGQTAD